MSAHEANLIGIRRTDPVFSEYQQAEALSTIFRLGGRSSEISAAQLHAGLADPAHQFVMEALDGSPIDPGLGLYGHEFEASPLRCLTIWEEERLCYHMAFLPTNVRQTWEDAVGQIVRRWMLEASRLASPPGAPKHE